MHYRSTRADANVGRYRTRHLFLSAGGQKSRGLKPRRVEVRVGSLQRFSPQRFSVRRHCSLRIPIYTPISCVQGFCKLRLYFRIDELRDVVSIRRAPPDPAERCASCAKTPSMVATRGRGPERPYVPGSTPAFGGAVPLARRS